MDKLKKIAVSSIEENSKIFIELSNKIWDNPELSLKEYKSVGIYVKLLLELGFEVEESVAGIPTAFLGKWGSGRPVIGILGEYDALSGLSQAGGVAERRELVKGGRGTRMRT